MPAPISLDFRLEHGRDPVPFLGAITPLDRRWPRIVLMLVAGPVAALVLGMVATFGSMVLSGHYGYDLAPGVASVQSPMAVGALFILQISFGLGSAAGGVLLVASLVFRRSPMSWMTIAPRIRWRLLVFGFTASVIGISALGLVSDLFPHPQTQAPILDTGQSADLRSLYAVAALVGFMIAAWAEEVVFRGYLLQQICAITRRPWVALVLSAALFSAIHLEFTPAALASRAIIGLAFGWTALRLGGLEFAIGAHAANNLMIALFSQVLLPNSPPQTGGPSDLAMELALAIFTVGVAEWAGRGGLGDDRPSIQAFK